MIMVTLLSKKKKKKKKKNGCDVLVATYFNIVATCKSHTKLRP